MSSDYLLFILEQFFYLPIDNCNSLWLVFKLLHPYFLCNVWPCIYVTVSLSLSLKHILFIYSYLIRFLFDWVAVSNRCFPTCFIFTSRWTNVGAMKYKNVYVRICARARKQHHVATTLWTPPRNKSFYFPGWFLTHIEFISSTYDQKATNWVWKRGSLPTRTIRRNLLYCHKPHQWNEAAVSISGKWKAVGGLCGTVEAYITCNKSSEGHTYMHLCLHLLLNGLHSNT